MTEVHDRQPLTPTKDKWLLVTVTDYSEPILQITRYVMPDSKRSREWVESLTNFTTGVNATPIEVMGAPQGVHAVLRYEDEDRDWIACGLDDQRRKRHGQTIDQAFYRVHEAITCGRCKASIRDNDALIADGLVKTLGHGAVLKPWSWENVPEDYRPGGPKHRYTEGEQPQ
jgi:hypothetical protein